MRGRSTLLRTFGILAAIVGLAVSARADQVIYDDALQNGWMNWSWCGTNLSATNYVHSGSVSAQATYTAAWQGFYLSHGNFDSSPYVSLQFWVNGGTTNGRNIQVQGLINGAAKPTVSLGAYVTITAGKWKQVTIPLTALQVDHNAAFSGFWLQDASGGAQPAFYVDDVSLISVPPPPVVHLNVNAGQILQQVDGRMFGINAAVWDDQFNSMATVTQLKTMGNKILRFPGGSLSDTYHFQSNTTDGNTWQWATSFDAFAGVAKSYGADAFITVNYGSGTAQEAANWVSYSNKSKKYGFHYWEIGNECYGTWENDTHSAKNDPFTYALQTKAYIHAMKLVDPTIKVGVVVVPGEDSYVNNTNHPATNPRTHAVHNGWTPVLLAGLKAVGITPDFVIHHRYEQGPGQESDAGLLQAASTWKNDAQDLRGQLNDYLGAAGNTVEIVCTENNSVYTNPGKQSTSLVNGLYFADSLGQLIQTEIRSLVWWNFRNGGTSSGNNNSASLYGWRNYGDYGVIESGGPFPVYYMSKLMSLFMGSGDNVVPATSDYNLLSVYSVKRPNGKLSLLVINKHPSMSLNANIAVTGFKPQAAAALASYGIPQDDSARTGTGSPDVARFTIGNAGPSFSISFAPYSATVISLTLAP